MTIVLVHSSQAYATRAFEWHASCLNKYVNGQIRKRTLNALLKHRFIIYGMIENGCK